jgi:hypothetical protein
MRDLLAHYFFSKTFLEKVTTKHTCCGKEKDNETQARRLQDDAFDDVPYL